MLRKATPMITNFINENKFKMSDYTEAEKMYLAKHAKKPRVNRTDLVAGDLVVVCEGKYAGAKVVFIKQMEGNKAVVCGVKEFNNVGVFAIDEDYLFKLNVSIKLGSVNVPANLFVSELNETTEEEAAFENSLNLAIKSAVESVEYLKGYMGEAFSVDHSIDFYSQNY